MLAISHYKRRRKQLRYFIMQRWRQAMELTRSNLSYITTARNSKNIYVTVYGLKVNMRFDLQRLVLKTTKTINDGEDIRFRRITGVGYNKSVFISLCQMNFMTKEDLFSLCFNPTTSHTVETNTTINKTTRIHKNYCNPSWNKNTVWHFNMPHCPHTYGYE